jgi:hypothetical protein
MDYSHHDPNYVTTSYPFNERHTTSTKGYDVVALSG